MNKIFIILLLLVIIDLAYSLGTCYCVDGFIFNMCPNQIQCYHFCSEGHISMSKFVSVGIN